jgi:hypothetical protein
VDDRAGVFDGLPVLVVGSYAEITSETLDEAAKRFNVVFDDRSKRASLVRELTTDAWTTRWRKSTA